MMSYAGMEGLLTPFSIGTHKPLFNNPSQGPTAPYTDRGSCAGKVRRAIIAGGEGRKRSLLCRH